MALQRKSCFPLDSQNLEGCLAHCSYSTNSCKMTIRKDWKENSIQEKSEENHLTCIIRFTSASKRSCASEGDGTGKERQYGEAPQGPCSYTAQEGGPHHTPWPCDLSSQQVSVWSSRVNLLFPGLLMPRVFVMLLNQIVCKWTKLIEKE